MRILFLIITFLTCACAYADSFAQITSCESNSVRLEKVTPMHYGSTVQLVIDHQIAINHLWRAGGVNSFNMNGNSEFLLRSMEFDPSDGNFYGYSPRDGGTLVYRVKISGNNYGYNNQSVLDLSVGWTNASTLGMKRDFRPFAGFRFYGCSR